MRLAVALLHQNRDELVVDDGVVTVVRTSVTSLPADGDELPALVDHPIQKLARANVLLLTPTLCIRRIVDVGSAQVDLLARDDLGGIEQLRLDEVDDLGRNF